MRGSSKTHRPRAEVCAPALLAFEDVSLRFQDHTVFRRTNWAIRAGEQWVILGPNNSGKSLFASALAGETQPAAGEVDSGGAEASPAGRRPAALVSPATHRAVANAESSFYQSRWHSGLTEGRYTVNRFLSQEQIEDINPFEVTPHRSPRKQFLARRNQVVQWLNLDPLLRRKLLWLSNGEMRRVLIARAWLQNPQLLVLDEPFAGLDTKTRRHLHRVIARMMRSGQPVVVVTARADEIPKPATHLLLVNRHRIIAAGTRARLIRHPLLRRLRNQSSRATKSPLRPFAEPQPASARARAKAAPGREPLVEIRNATIRHGRKAILKDVSWTVQRGEHWALLGPNGSGKTTLLSLIQGDNPQAYSVNMRLFGISPDTTQALWQARRYLGWLSPELHLHYPPEWSCLDVVCSGQFDSMGLYEPCPAGVRRHARSWLREFGFSRFENTPLGERPLGDQRLVLLARALVKRPRLLVLDEPCQALDRSHRELVLNTLDRVVAATDTTLLFVTHHRREMPGCIRRVLQLKDGRTAYAGALRPA